jgi:hypothetical protein
MFVMAVSRVNDKLCAPPPSLQQPLSDMLGIRHRCGGGEGRLAADLRPGRSDPRDDGPMCEHGLRYGLQDQVLDEPVLFQEHSVSSPTRPLSHTLAHRPLVHWFHSILGLPDERRQQRSLVIGP